MRILTKNICFRAGRRQALLGVGWVTLLLLVSYCQNFRKKASQPQSPPWLTLEKTGCYGSCPQYKLAVYSNGIVLYQGRKFVKNLGVFEKRLSKTAIQEIKRLIAQSSFFTYEDVYDNEGISDLPSVILYCALEGKEKKVIARINVPPEFPQLVAKIETLIGENGYQPSTKNFP
jgi:hypothetical protein